MTVGEAMKGHMYGHMGVLHAVKNWVHVATEKGALVQAAQPAEATLTLPGPALEGLETSIIWLKSY